MTDRQQMAVSAESEFTLQCGEAARRLKAHLRDDFLFFCIYQVVLGKTPIFQRAHKQHTVAEELYLTPPSEVSPDAFARRLIEMSLHFAVVLLMTLQKTLKRLPRSAPPGTLIRVCRFLQVKAEQAEAGVPG